MIDPLAQEVRSGQRRGYEGELAGLWSELQRALRRLERIAARPDEELVAEESPEELSRLRYTLHTASERAFGLEPPPGEEAAHEELALALAEARDATAEIAEAVEDGGPEASALLVHEWRGALFRVRLARMRLTGAPPAKAGQAAEGRALLAPLASFALVAAGAAAFVLGAVLSSWPIWLAGMLAVVAGLLVYRP